MSFEREIAMSRIEQYENVFASTFNIPREELKNLKYQDIQAWDSVGHMSLIAALEKSFGVTLDTDDIIDFSSFEKGKDILKKYGVEL